MGMKCFFWWFYDDNYHLLASLALRKKCSIKRLNHTKHLTFSNSCLITNFQKRLSIAVDYFLSNFWTSHAQKHYNRAAYWFIWFSALLQKQSERAWCTRCKADGLLAASCVSCSYILPVDHIPNGLQIIGPDIFILKVISMLPHVNPQQGDKTCCSLQGILVRTSSNL